MTIDPDGNATRHHWDIGDGTLKRLQESVGGYVDVVRLHPAMDMWVNDTGILDGLPVNPCASLIAATHGHTRQPYFGTVVFTGGADDDGNTRSLSAGLADALLDLTHEIRARL